MIAILCIMLIISIYSIYNWKWQMEKTQEMQDLADEGAFKKPNFFVDYVKENGLGTNLLLGFVYYICLFLILFTNSWWLGLILGVNLIIYSNIQKKRKFRSKVYSALNEVLETGLTLLALFLAF